MKSCLVEVLIDEKVRFLSCLFYVGIVDKTIRKDVDKMIAKEQNLDLNSYRLHANDPEHPFNWFYQHLLHKNSDTKHSEDERTKITLKE